MIISAAILIVSPTVAFSQVTVTDMSCPTCQEISDHKTLMLYQELLPLVIWTPSTIYDHDSKIQVHGHSNIQSSIPITLTVTDPKGNLVNVDQAMPNYDGKFMVEFNTKSPMWNKDGRYIITAQAGHESAGKIFRIPVNILADVGSDSLIKYEIEGGNVVAVKPNEESNSIMLTLSETNSDGILNVHLPRDIINAELESKEITGMAGVGLPQLHQTNYDSDFMILVDGNRISKLNENLAQVEISSTMPVGTYTEKTILDTRILTISFPSGTEKIEIMGSYVVPEFGAIAVLVFMVAITAILVLSAKNGLFQTLKIQ